MKLSARDVQILTAAAAGENYKETAMALGTAPITVNTQRRNLLRKLGVPNMCAAVSWGYQNGVLPMNAPAQSARAASLLYLMEQDPQKRTTVLEIVEAAAVGGAAEHDIVEAAEALMRDMGALS